jgi:integrase
MSLRIRLSAKRPILRQLMGSLSQRGFGNWFRTQCDAAGLTKCSAHGLRKIGAVRAAENGASEHELMALFGWENAEMARIHTRKAAQKRMAVSAAAKMQKGMIPGDLRVPPSVPPEENAFISER